MDELKTNANMQIKKLKVQSKIDISKARIKAPAIEVASKAIGRQGLFYISFMLVLAVSSSYFLDKDRLTAVIGLVSVVVGYLATMLQSITSKQEKELPPEKDEALELIRDMFKKIVELSNKPEEPASLYINGDNIEITKGNTKFSNKRSEDD